MRKRNKVAGLGLISLGLIACVLWGRQPTPLPGVEDATSPTPQPLTTETHLSAPTRTPTREPAKTPTPTPESSPTPTARPTASPTPVQRIRLESPQAGAALGNPFPLQGRITNIPAQKHFIVHIIDARGQLAAEVTVPIAGIVGQSGTFQADVLYGGVPGPGSIEILEDKDESTSASIAVTLQGFPGGGYVEEPTPQARTTLPLRLLARAGQPGTQVNVTVAWEDDVSFARLVPVLQGTDGRGFVMGALDWVIAPHPQPTSQRATLSIHSLEGEPLARQELTILSPNDPGTMGTDVYWIQGEQVVAEPIRIPRTLGIGRASLNALLWGPVPGNAAAYTTAIPSPEEILAYPGRGPTWGEHVRVQELTIKEGTAYADFSAEILAHSGGALRVTLIREQIEKTLLQFSTVNAVVITVDGQPDMLEP